MTDGTVSEARIRDHLALLDEWDNLADSEELSRRLDAAYEALTEEEMDCVERILSATRKAATLPS